MYTQLSRNKSFLKLVTRDKKSIHALQKDDKQYREKLTLSKSMLSHLHKWKCPQNSLRVKVLWMQNILYKFLITIFHTKFNCTKLNVIHNFVAWTRAGLLSLFPEQTPTLSYDSQRLHYHGLHKEMTSPCQLKLVQVLTNIHRIPCIVSDVQRVIECYGGIAQYSLVQRYYS